jgi:hypothetical protein
MARSSVSHVSRTRVKLDRNRYGFWGINRFISVEVVKTEVDPTPKNSASFLKHFNHFSTAFIFSVLGVQIPLLAPFQDSQAASGDFRFLFPL